MKVHRKLTFRWSHLIAQLGYNGAVIFPNRLNAATKAKLCSLTSIQHNMSAVNFAHYNH